MLVGPVTQSSGDMELTLSAGGGVCTVYCNTHRTIYVVVLQCCSGGCVVRGEEGGATCEIQSLTLLSDTTECHIVSLKYPERNTRQRAIQLSQ